jgi:peptide deformylase
MFEIRIYGDPVLRKTAKKVTVFNEELKQFSREMAETMRAKDGVGLAATQVGKSVQFAVVDVTAGEKEPFVLINPEIIWSSTEIADEEEGCLSVPAIRLKVKRPASVSVRALDINGKAYTIEKAEGVMARALQHETDHLNGVLFIDRVSLLQRKLISGKLRKLANSGDLDE